MAQTKIISFLSATDAFGSSLSSTQARSQLGTLWGEEFSKGGPNFSNNVQ